MSLNDFLNSKFKKFNSSSKKLSSRITISYLILFIIIIFIFDILVVFLTEQYLMSNNQGELIKNRDYIVSLCEENKETILETPVEERLHFIANNIKYRNSEFRYTNFYLDLKDNYGNAYQPFFNEVFNFENANINFDISNTIFLYDKEHTKDSNVQFLMDDKNQYLYLFTIVPFNEDYFVEIYLMRDIHESVVFIQNLTTTIMAVSFAGFLLLLIIGRLTTKRALKPLTKIANITHNITTENLNERIPEYPSGGELDILINALNDMIERLETSFKAQNQFVSDASHELRIPLTIIQGYVEILDTWGANDKEITQESIEAIKNETHNMHNLVEKLLFLARIENNRLKMSFNTFNVNEMIERVCSDFKLISPNHHFEIKENDKCTIFADENLILQVLRATLENCIKYTEKGGTITLKCKKTNTHIIISIKDTGIGIKKDDLEKICDRFYRVDSSRTKQTGGTGLGMSIVKSIISLHNGKINIKSEYGKGTEFIYKLPQNIKKPIMNIKKEKNIYH